MRPPAPGRVRLVRVRPGVGEPVPVRRPATQVPALLPGLGGHCGPDPDPGKQRTIGPWAMRWRSAGKKRVTGLE